MKELVGALSNVYWKTDESYVELESQTERLIPVSYTHLDVYKRQLLYRHSQNVYVPCFRNIL